MEAHAIISKPEYICIHLEKLGLDTYTRNALEYLGVEDLQEGEPYQAYGITENVELMISNISGCKLVRSVERRDPPSGK